MVAGNRTKSTGNILIVCYTIVIAVSLSGGTNDHSSHLLRHHQHGKVVDEVGIANETEGKASRTPDLVVKPREEIYLNCYLPQTAIENVGFAITWHHNGLVVDAVEIGAMGNGNRYFRDSSNGQLFISSVRLEDDGLWYCQYQGRKLEKSKPMKLVVLDKPRFPYLLVDGRRLDTGNNFLPVKESLDLMLTCLVEGGNPRPTIKWMVILSSNLDPVLLDESGAELGLNVTETRGSDVTANRVSSLELTRSEARIASIQRIHHKATVVCIVDHPALKSPLNASILLDVQYGPSFAISREPGFGFPLREGMAVSLKCDVDSNPPSSPIWLKDDSMPSVPQTVDGFLNFTSIKKEHSGWYKCTSHHLLGEFSSIGYFLNVRNGLHANLSQDSMPDSQPTGRQVEVPLGGVVQLQCPEEAMGCWSRVGNNGRLEPVGPGPGLLLSNIIYQDAGEYRCVSSKRGKYDRWRSEVNVDVTVKGHPVVYPVESTVVGQSGQKLQFSVEYCANPPATRAFWITETQRLHPGQIAGNFIAQNITPASSIHCLNAILTLQKAREIDSGEYMFLVKSSLGVSQGTIFLNITPEALALGSRNGIQIVALVTALLLHVIIVF